MLSSASFSRSLDDIPDDATFSVITTVNSQLWRIKNQFAHELQRKTLLYRPIHVNW